MLAGLLREADRRWPGKLRTSVQARGGEIECAPDLISELCSWLWSEQDLSFACLIAEERNPNWELRYVWYGDGSEGLVHVVARQSLAERAFPA